MSQTLCVLDEGKPLYGTTHVNCQHWNLIKYTDQSDSLKNILCSYAEILSPRATIKPNLHYS